MATQQIQHDPRRARRAVVAAGMGNILEWYDIIIYAFMAPVIAPLFFPSEDPVVSQIAYYLGIGVTYLIRPVGAIVIGNFGDRRGRKAALTLTIGLMTVGVAMIAFAPTYAVIGIGAPILLMTARLVQGFSAGGEFGSATAFMTENAQRGKAYYASWQVATQGGAMLLAGLTGWILFSNLDQTTLQDWGWRIPFALGILIGPVGLWIRIHLPDTPEFEAAEQAQSNPVLTVLRDHIGRLVTAAACVGMATMSVYLITYLPNFAIGLGLPDWSGYAGAFLAGTVAFVLSPLVGLLADRYGQTRIMLAAAAVGAIVIVPLVQLIVTTGAVWALMLAEVVVGILMAAYFAPLPSLLVQMFPVNIRTTGVSLTYNLGVTAMGSFAPVILTAWVPVTPLAPAFYYLIVAAISVTGVLLARKVFDQP